MATKTQKKDQIRQQIVDAAKVYSADLAGKKFLYVYGEEYFEVLFKTDRFQHLTGVESNLNAKDFYQKAKNGSLSTGQFDFSINHPMGVAKKKLPCLQRLPELTNTMVCIVKRMATVTLTYTIGVTNFEFTLGLTENLDAAGRKIDDLYLPRTLRVKDRAVENSSDGEIVDFIFMKDASKAKYEVIMFKDEKKSIPDSIKGLLGSNLLNDTLHFEHNN